MLASAGEINLVDTNHLFDIHLVLDDCDFMKLTVIEAAEYSSTYILAMRCGVSSRLSSLRSEPSVSMTVVKASRIRSYR